MAKNQLTPRQAAFAREYLIDLNATQAAIRAGYSEKTARAQGNRLLTNAYISAAIAEGQQERAERLQIDADTVLQEIAKLAYVNMRDFIRITPNGDAYIDLSDLTRDQAAALAEITVEDFLDGRGEDSREVRRVKIKLADKKGSLELLGKHLGLFTDRVDLTSGGQPLKAYVGFDPEAV